MLSILSIIIKFCKSKSGQAIIIIVLILLVIGIIFSYVTIQNNKIEHLKKLNKEHEAWQLVILKEKKAEKRNEIIEIIFTNSQTIIEKIIIHELATDELEAIENIHADYFESVK